MADQLDDDYGLTKIAAAREITPPELPYRPPSPRRSHAIGLVGCGGIAAQHLAAYRAAGYQVVALCDRNEHKVRDRQVQYFPEAFVTTDYRELLRRDDVEVVDITPHPHDRAPIVEAALAAGKHVLSQKPFVTNLDHGEQLCELAERRSLKLAVNQNGRWAPHFSYMRQALAAGLLGELASAHLSVHWDHSWIIGTAFEDIHDLVLYDFGVHWFDIVTAFFGSREARRVYAATGRASGQRARPPLLATVLAEYDGGQASLCFNAAVVHGQQDRTYLAGSTGTAISTGPSLSEQAVTVHTAAGFWHAPLEGTWFREGFHGTMAELLCAIEDGREPANGARENLRSLALAFAAIASSHTGEPKTPGHVRTLPG
jgi:predicted dehydrogenase